MKLLSRDGRIQLPPSSSGTLLLAASAAHALLLLAKEQSLLDKRVEECLEAELQALIGQHSIACTATYWCHCTHAHRMRC